MKKKEFTLKEINYHLKDEKKGEQQYRKEGLPKLAKAEHSHYEFWVNQKKKLK